VVKQNRRNTTLQLLKRAVTEKRFGKIHMVHLNVFWTRPQAYYDQGNGWRGTWEFDGGAFMNQASHYVDLLDWLIGPVEKVQAMMSTTRDIEVEDTGVLNVKWRNGALGSVSVTMLTYPENLEGSITILGEKGTIRIGGVAVMSAEINTTQRQLIEQLGREVIVVPDRDQAGQNLVKQAIEFNWSVSFPDWPEGIKDVNECLTKHGRLYTLYSILDKVYATSLKIQLQQRQWLKND
jgi:predicted dehydrogenase